MTRLRHPDGQIVHLAYCTNVHPAQDLVGVLSQLERYAAPVRQRLGWQRLGLGLWLAAPLARSLASDTQALADLHDRLTELGLEVVTLNGFPYESFQAAVVKLAVYQPDWRTQERLRYTLDLAQILSRLMPQDATEGSISTLPLGWREGWSQADTDAARAALDQVAHELAKLEHDTGRLVRLAIEPEPGCAVETTDQAIAALDGLDPRYVGLCLDACHAAVQFESPEHALASLHAAGLPIVKVQASAALRASGAAKDELERFVEPRFMHQARALTPAGVVAVDDLDQALAGGLPDGQEWRVHFHVPVHLDDGRTTQPELRKLLAGVFGGEHPVSRHLELETYTWDVLPGSMRPDDEQALVAGLAEELRWLADTLRELGLKEADL